MATALLLAVPAVRAQDVAVRVLDARADGQRVEVTVAWPSALHTALEAAGARAFTGAAATAAAGTAFTAEHVVSLPAVALPAVSVAEVDAEEVPLAPGDAGEAFAGPLAEAVAPGKYRGRPVATLVARLLTYDPAAQRLRRVRRLVVDVAFGRGVPAPRFARSGAGASVPNPHLAVTRSVLADGTVFKVPIREEGVYRLDADAVRALGLTPASVDPATVRVFNNGNAQPAARTDAPRLADLAETPVVVRGGGDGRFDDGDAVLFYVRGPQAWSLAGDTAWVHTTHPYSTDGYVFLKFGAGAGRAVEAASAAATGPDLTQVEGRFVAEFDELSWSKENGSGLTWVSRQISPGGANRTVVASTDLPGLAPGTLRYHAAVAVRTVGVSPSAAVRFTVGGGTLFEGRYGSVSSASISPTAVPAEARFTQAHTGAAFTTAFGIGPAPGGTENAVALDWARVFYPQALTATGGALRFATPRNQRGPLGLVLGGFAAEPTVWDVTDPALPRRLAPETASGGYRVRVDASAGPREIVAFTDAGAKRLPTGGRRVAPQNLHAPAVYPDLVIVTPDTFRTHAEELAGMRRAEGLRVEVASVDAVYNEFSGGQQDVRGIRDYFKFLYDRAPSDGLRLRYALLFGDGHYNVRGLGERPEQRNWIPPYETAETFDPILSYTTDDYFGVLDDGEGEWAGYTGDGDRVDVGIGRLPVQTPADATAFLAKLRRYADPATYGAWRTRYVFSADDGYDGSNTNTESDLHMANADGVAEFVKAVAPPVNLRKVYALSYDRVFATRWRVPAANQAILDALREGTLVFNYSGHGNTTVLAHEDLFTRSDAERLDNLDRLPVFVTATCSFGRWDMDDEQSAGEVLLTNPDGGAIASFTTVRVVYTSRDPNSLNPGINRALNRALFTRDADGLPPRLGDAYVQLKQDAAGSVVNSRKFNLLGDPSMRFGLPGLDVRVERVNGVDLATVGDDAAAFPKVRALDRVTVEGTVRNPDGTEATGFDGRVTLTAFDAERQVPLPYHDFFAPSSYLVREDLLWRGDVQATGGRFAATFVVPRDIAYADRPGRIAAYAYEGEAQGAGATQRVLVGGTNPSPVVDTKGPEVRLFLGDTTFVAGSLVGASPELIVRLYDANGINTVGAGVGHELLLTYTNAAGAVRTENLGSLFRADAGSYQRGEVRYRLSDLAPGAGTLKVRAWDVVGNATEQEVAFTAAGAEALQVQRLANFPNPTAGPTRISFEHNQPLGTAATVEVKVFTLAGQLVRVLRDAETLPAGVLGAGRVTIPWDGKDADGDRLAPGVYLYALRVEVTGDEGARQIAERIERLAVVR